MNEIEPIMNYCSSNSPVRAYFSDVTNKKLQVNDIVDDDHRWKSVNGNAKIFFFVDLFFVIFFYLFFHY